MPPTITWSLRETCQADETFLRALFISTRVDEEAIRHWSQAQKMRFLSMQFEAQDTHYKSLFPKAERWIVCAGGKDVGRIILNKGANDIHIVDISLLPSFRNKGIGSSILQWVFDQANASRAQVSLSVRFDNPARSLYQRFGFKEGAGSSPPYLNLVRIFHAE